MLPAACVISLGAFLAFGPSIRHRISIFQAAKLRDCAAPPRLPSKDPIFGLDTGLVNLRWMRENRRIREIYKQVQTYGKTFESWPFGRRVITTADARNIQHVLATEHEKFGVGPVRELAQTPMTGKGIITSDGGVWAHGRSLIRPTFTRSQIADRVMIEGHVDRFLDAVDDAQRADVGVDLQPWFDRLILDASSEFTFGESFHSLSPDCSIDSQAFLDCFAYAQKGVGLRVLMGKMSFLLRDRRFWDSCRVIREYTQKHVDRALSHRRQGSQELNDKDAHEKYILIHEMAKETTDRHVLCSQLLNVFFAGRDTPAVALANIFFCLARHPEVWERIRAEVAGLQIDDLTFERLKSLRYVQHTINEALRLYPPVPNQSRGCLAPTMLPFGGEPDGPSPICVVPGDTISMPFFTLHRNPEVFEHDPQAFRPDRWKTIRPSWEYLPFGGGARHCPAQQLALYWIAYTIVRMAIKCRGIENKDEVEEFVESLKLNMESANGVKVKLV
ncbi:cytochrome P450 [Lophiostoma macrostomum CBS 122681]|uniref:Cytochrome P450 n=1 Tax=Lophiostoma macrostomum CBS 122681 TaxID=1314788 RepID=A0A6A6TGS3_9PLEO|nr:cytochrome P450 [Lophiostoma macrostomum CBS 122681]